MGTTINLVNTVAKVVTPIASDVAVSKASVIAKQVSVQSNVKVGETLPQEVKSGQVESSSEQVIEDRVSELNSFVQNIQRGIQFSAQEESGRSIITVTDKDTGDVIRSFPSEQMLAISKHLAESLAVQDDAGRGLLVNEKL